MDLETEKKKILSTVKNDQTLQRVLEEVQFIKQNLGKNLAAPQDKHPSLERIEKLFQENDFDPAFTTFLLEQLRRELTLQDLEDYSLVQERTIQMIGDGISLYRETNSVRPRIFILVGPTGVGKTTTIAKLAALHGLGSRGESAKMVRMLTIDNYRIGARQQIETYGEIMRIPVQFVTNSQDLKKQLALFEDSDLILIDTIGKSPKEYMDLAEMKEILAVCGERAETHLALSATTKTSDIKEILQQFEPFKYQSIVLTKLDETMRIGNILSVLADRRKPISYITDGQAVPADIEKASVLRLLMTLEGFKIDKNNLEKRYRENLAAGPAGRFVRE